MAGTPISRLPAAAALTGAEQFPCVQDSITVRTTLNAIGEFGANHFNPFPVIHQDEEGDVVAEFPGDVLIAENEGGGPFAASGELNLGVASFSNGYVSGDVTYTYKNPYAIGGVLAINWPAVPYCGAELYADSFSATGTDSLGGTTTTTYPGVSLYLDTLNNWAQLGPGEAPTPSPGLAPTFSVWDQSGGRRQGAFGVDPSGNVIAAGLVCLIGSVTPGTPSFTVSDGVTSDTASIGILFQGATLASGGGSSLDTITVNGGTPSFTVSDGVTSDTASIGILFNGAVLTSGGGVGLDTVTITAPVGASTYTVSDGTTSDTASIGILFQGCATVTSGGGVGLDTVTVVPTVGLQVLGAGAHQMLFTDASGDLTTDPSIQVYPASGTLTLADVSVTSFLGRFTGNLAAGTGGYFSDTANTVFIADGVYAINVTAGSVQLGVSTIIINTVAYTWPSTQTTGFLEDDGAGNLSWTALTSPAGTITISGATLDLPTIGPGAGTYIVGAPLTPITGLPGTITVDNYGRITAIQEAT